MMALGCVGTRSSSGHLAPLAGRGRIALAIRVRGTIRESESAESPLTPTLSPQVRSEGEVAALFRISGRDHFDLDQKSGIGECRDADNGPCRQIGLTAAEELRVALHESLKSIGARASCTKNTCILTTSPMPSPRPSMLALILVSAPIVWVLVSP